MPELPEVEVVRAGLARHVVGRTFATVEVLHPRAVRRHLAGPADFAAGLTGLTVTAACRRGKYLWLPLVHGSPAAGDLLTTGAQPATGHPAALSGSHRAAGPLAGRPAATRGMPCPPYGVAPAAEDALLAHLGMSGQLLLGDPDRPLAPHVRVRFTFTDGGPDLRFTDQRTFGHLVLVRGGAVLPPLIAHIAPDPMEPAFDEAAVIAKLRSKHTAIKTALLDQSLVSGVGNIYADEALWRARLHWARPAASLRRADAVRLLAAVRQVLDEALTDGGTTFDSLYVNVNGESGFFGRSLAVYGREGQPCLRCGAPIRRDPFMNRSAYSCPVCQRSPRPQTGASELRHRST